MIARKNSLFALCAAVVATAVLPIAVFAEQPDEFIQYIQADGNTAQYLNTGVKGRYGTKAEMKLEWLDLGNSNDIDNDVAFLCARAGNNRVYFCHNNSRVVCAGYGAYAGMKRGGMDCKWEVKRVYTVVTEYSATNSSGKVTATMSVDGEQLWNTSLNSVNTELDLYLFAINKDGSISNPGAARCYGLKIWQDGALVRDYRPCVKDGRGALYDAANDEICYSSGGSDFHYDATANVPDEFIDYVEARGNSYIDTGVIGRSGTKAAGEFAFLAREDKSILDSRIGDGNTRIYMLHNYNLNFMYGYKSYTDTGSKITLGTKYYVESELNAGSQTMYVSADGSGVTNQIANATDASEFNTGFSLYLFACNYGGSPNYYSKARCYGLKIWQDGDLKRDYKPCLKNGVPCLYDVVSGRIFYAERQSFFYERNYDTVARNDVAFVEYIESDGYSYLDTGVRGRSDTRAQGEFCWTRSRLATEEKNTYLEEANLINAKARYERCYLGSTYWKSSSDIGRFYMLHESDKKLYVGYGKNAQTLSTTITGNTKYVFDISLSNGAQTLDITPEGGETIHAVSWSYADTVDSEGNLYLFALNDTFSGLAKCEMAARCYGLTLWQDGVKVRDFKPCVYKDKAMLYDEVSGKVFRPSPDIAANGNTGAPLGSAQPGVYVEYVETDGSQYIDTGVIGKAGTKIEFVETSLSRNSNDDESLIGARASESTDSRFYMWQHGTEWTLGFGYGKFNRPKTNDPTGNASSYSDPNARKLRCGDTVHAIVSFEAGGQRADVIGSDGSVTNVMNWSIADNIDTGKNLYLFAANVAGTPQMFCKSRFYWMKIWQDGRLVRYYRPVRLENGYVVLWDMVENQGCVLKSTRASEAAGYFSAVGPDGKKALNGLMLIIR